VKQIGDEEYVYIQPRPLDLDIVKLRAIERAFKIVEQRLINRPQLGWQRVMREELAEMRRQLIGGEEQQPVSTS
jgi:hypothetical protein